MTRKSRRELERELEKLSERGSSDSPSVPEWTDWEKEILKTVIDTAVESLSDEELAELEELADQILEAQQSNVSDDELADEYVRLYSILGEGFKA